jgi:hypothetical protein
VVAAHHQSFRQAIEDGIIAKLRTLGGHPMVNIRQIASA